MKTARKIISILQILLIPSCLGIGFLDFESGINWGVTLMIICAGLNFWQVWGSRDIWDEK